MGLYYRILFGYAQLLTLLCFITGVRSTDEDGHWGQWGPLNPCSATCGIGTATMTRVWIPGPNVKPPKVPYTSIQEFTCTNEALPDCPQDGEWTEWASWTSCTKVCGGGLRERQRECHGQLYEGKACEGESFAREDCNRQPCPPLPRNFDMSQCTPTTNFTCTSQKMCVPLVQKCDMTVQCHDGSDENDCYNNHQLRGNSIRYGLSMWRNGAVSKCRQAITNVVVTVTLIVNYLFH